MPFYRKLDLSFRHKVSKHTSMSRTKSQLKRIVLLFLVALPLVGLGMASVAARSIEMAGAWAVRDHIKRLKENPDPQDALLDIAEDIHLVFANSVDRDPPNLLLRLRPYLTNDLLPNVLRVEPGAIEALYLNGWCDNAARALMFVASEAGLEAHQLNIITPNAGHSILEIKRPSGEYVAIDPYYGVVAASGGELIPASEAFERTALGSPPSSVWHLNGANALHSFYANFTSVILARQGSGATIAIHADPASYPINLGHVDGNDDDVRSAGQSLGFTPYWNYLGNRYDRSWVRRLNVSVPSRVTIVTAGPLRDYAITANIPYESRSDSRLVYVVDAQMPLELVDGNAQRDWLSFRSWIPIDRISIEPLDVRTETQDQDS